MNYKILIVVVSNNQKQQKFYFLQNFVFNWFCGFFLWVSLTIFPCLYFHVYFRSLVLSRLNVDQDNTFLNFKQTVEKMCKARVAKPPSSKHLWDLAKGVHFVKGFSDRIKVCSSYLRINILMNCRSSLHEGRISKVLI